MTPAELTACCLALNGTSSDVPFPRSPDITVFRVATKIFAICALEDRPLKVSLKCAPEEAIRLRETHPEIVPGWHLNKRHWNTVTVGPLPARMVRELIEDSYDLVVAGLPKQERLKLDRP
ncbi:MmcQ/YjbR family DNA-binding protein [Streptomyces sp. NPDC087525]|uniref:MmcQ/YjbR family DNA-binding protein n=1 Tax=Streptomyces sp. NPDC087525 TaxID=3365793 RepID=UPI0037F601C3